MLEKRNKARTEMNKIIREGVFLDGEGLIKLLNLRASRWQRLDPGMDVDLERLKHICLKESEPFLLTKFQVFMPTMTAHMTIEQSVEQMKDLVQSKIWSFMARS